MLRDQAGASPTTVTVSVTAEAHLDPQDWRAKKIRDWQLLLLRFAITHDPHDQALVMAMADEIDGLGLTWRPAAPTFFSRTSADLCRAIVTVDDSGRIGILTRHAARIEDPRLRRAFRAAVDLSGEIHSGPQTKRNRRRLDLWRGLR